MATSDDIRAQIEASRVFTIALPWLEGASITVRLPSQYRMRTAAENNRAGGEVREAQMFHELLREAVVGWGNVPLRAVDPDAGEGWLTFTDDARALLLENNMRIADHLAIEMSREIARRRDKQEAETKN